MNRRARAKNRRLNKREIGTYLFGRKTYETMAVWETPGQVPVKLELLDERRFGNAMVHVRYRAKS